MNIDDYCKQINLSRDYSELYHLLIELGAPKDGRGIPCYVDYSTDRNNPNAKKLRDIAAAKFWPNGLNFSIGARGIEYGGDVGYFNRMPLESDFIKECERMNLEWVKP